MPLTRSKVLEPPQDHLLKRPGIRPAQAKIIRQDHRERTRAAWLPSGGPGPTVPYQLISPFSSSERARTHLIHGLVAVSSRDPERSAGSSGFPIEPCIGSAGLPACKGLPQHGPAVIPPGAAVMACPAAASGSGDHASSQRVISAAARAHNGQFACHRPDNRACQSSHADSAIRANSAPARPTQSITRRDACHGRAPGRRRPLAEGVLHATASDLLVILKPVSRPGVARHRRAVPGRRRCLPLSAGQNQRAVPS